MKLMDSCHSATQLTVERSIALGNLVASLSFMTCRHS